MMTIENNIPLEAYESIDFGCTDEFLKIIRAGASQDQLKYALATARDISGPDWNTWASEAAANIKVGRQMGDPTPILDL